MRSPRPATLGLPEPEETGDSFLANARSRRGPPRGDGAARDRGRQRHLRAALEASPASTPPAGPGPARTSPRHAGVEERLSGGASRADRAAWFISALCIAWPDGHVEEFEGRVDGTLVGRPAARTASATTRLPAGGPDAHLRRNDGGRKARPSAARARPVAPCARLRHALGGLPETGEPRLGIAEGPRATAGPAQGPSGRGSTT